jgi:hypothetical protein
MKTVKRNASIEIESITNCFILTFSGSDSKDDWVDDKIFVADIDSLCAFIAKWNALPVRS